MSFKKITIAGSGVLGSQIAFQIAFKGFDVTIYDVDDEAIEKAKETIGKLKDRYIDEIKKATEQVDKYASTMEYNRNLLPDIPDLFQEETKIQSERAEKAEVNLHYTDDLAKAVEDADYVIEAIPERTDIKKDFYQKLKEVAPEKTIFATNTSTFVPSQFASETGRPEKFLSMHFANEIWRNNIAEIMGHEKTDPKVIEKVVAFAKEIDMVPIQINKEQSGYILNSLLVPFLEAAQSLLANGVSDPATIDKTWMISTGAPNGPFATLDVVGIETAYNISKNYAETSDDSDNHHQKLADFLKREYLDKGKLGRSNGEGFYTYPNPEFEESDFLEVD